jgi:hypothetical protein
LPLIESESNGTGSLPRIVRRTVFKCVFIDMSTPVMVPLTTVPDRMSNCERENKLEERGVMILTIFEFNCDTLIVQLHEKPDKLHPAE